MTLRFWGFLKSNNLSEIFKGEVAVMCGDKLVRAECVRCPWLLAQTKVATIFDIFPHGGVLVLVLTLLPFTPERIVVGFSIFAWLLIHKNMKIPMKKEFRGPPLPP